MKKIVFENKLKKAVSKDNATLLMISLFEEVASLPYNEQSEIDEINISDMPKQVQAIIDSGLFDLHHMVDGETAASMIEYACNDIALQSAKIIFASCGLPKQIYIDSPEDTDYIIHLRTKLDYNGYNNDYLVKLYLLACSFYKGETYIHFNENLYAEMFSQEYQYTSLSSAHTPLYLTVEIFKDIEKFDFLVEMEKQQLGTCGCWKIHIYNKRTKIEVATYQ